MPYNKIRFIEEFKISIKITKEAKKESYRLLFFTFNKINYLFGYSFNEKLSPFLLKEEKKEFVIMTKHIYTKEIYKSETIGSLIPSKFNFNMSIKDFAKIYLNGELEIKETKEKKKIKRSINKKKINNL